MELPVVLPNRHPLASAVEVKRPYFSGSVRLEMPVEAEFIDFDKAQVEEAAMLCMDEASARQASALCSLAHQKGGGPPPNENVVYIVAPKSREACKIGMAANPAPRIAGLQTSHWQELELCGLFWCIHGNAELIERAALNAAKEAGFGIRGEWFNASPEFAAIVIASTAKGMGTKIADSHMWIRQREAIRQQREALEFQLRSPMRNSFQARGEQKY